MMPTNLPLQKHGPTVLFIGLVFALLTAAASFAFPLEYRADAQVLIISTSRLGGDPYAAVKSAQGIGESLVQVVKTNDFYGKVMGQVGYDLDRTQFENIPERTKRKRWEKTIDASVVYGTPVVSISTYHKNPAQAEAYAAAAGQALSLEAANYVGGDIAVRVINDPIVTRFPARPNILVNGLVGFLVGLVFGTLFLIKKTGRKEMFSGTL